MLTYLIREIGNLFNMRCMNMNKKRDSIIEILIWIVTSLLLIKFVPKNKIREASSAFLFKQVMTWLVGLLVVEKGLISYPHRTFFPKANKTSFTFEYFVYPALCSLFNIHYPEKKHPIIKLLYYSLHSSFITVFEVIALKFTNLIKYKNWTWYTTFITVWITYYLSHIYHRWFFKKGEFNDDQVDSAKNN